MIDGLERCRYCGVEAKLVSYEFAHLSGIGANNEYCARAYCPKCKYSATALSKNSKEEAEARAKESWNLYNKRNKVTDEERMRAAKGLREMTYCSLQESEICAFMDAIGIDGYADWVGIAHRLADLIEPAPKSSELGATEKGDEVESS